MIQRLKGYLAEVMDDVVIVDVGGVGYEVRVPLSTRSRLPQQGEPVTLYTHFSVRQDGVSLFGFLAPSELRLFNHLVSITGVGPKMALTVISSHTPDRFYQAILNEDVSQLTTVPGIGAKTAQRIILELRDKIGVPKRKGKDARGRAAPEVQGEGPVELAVEALMALGYGRMEATTAVERALTEAGAEPVVEELITRALRTLARI